MPIHIFLHIIGLFIVVRCHVLISNQLNMSHILYLLFYIARYINKTIPHLNDHDPANTHPITCSKLGLTRENQLFSTGHYPHLSRGGTRGFPLWMCTVAMNEFVVNSSYIQTAQRIVCSISSIRRWEEIILPYMMTGGTQREQLTGSDQILLSTCMFIYPAATNAEIAVFIYSNVGICIHANKSQIDTMNCS